MKSQYLKLFAFSFVFAISINLQAQDHVRGINDYINYANINRTNSPANKPYEEIKGSAYIFEEFETGKINLKDGKTYEGPLRYDVYANQFEFKTKEGEIYTIINPETIEKISIINRLFVFRIGDLKSNTGNYFEVLLDGEYSLLVKRTVILKDPVPEKPYVPGKPATFVAKADIYYVLNEKSELVEIKNKEIVAAIDPNRSNDISKFIKENKLKLSDKANLIELVNFLNDN